VGVPVQVQVTTGTTLQYKRPPLTILSSRLPFIPVSGGQFFWCCGDDVKCKLFMKSELDANQNDLRRGFYSKCTNNASGAEYQLRRLMQAEEEMQPCWAGQYNARRGDDTCFSCPNGASTPEPFTGTTARERCKCLPGYKAERDVDGRLKVCVPCGFNYHRNGTGLNDTLCDPCPPGMITPSSTSVSCYCKPGTFLYAPATCLECKPGMYCGGSDPSECPRDSTSPPGATTRSDCVCQAGFYGNLANPDSKCRPKPLGFSCEGECTCASGWTPVYNVSADGARLTMRCILQCELGEYAQIEPSTFVKVLPCSLL